MPARSLPTSRIRLSLVGFYAVAMLTSGCWVRNGSYCQQDSDCESNICADYQPMVKAGTCASALAQSTKQCRLTLTCIDKVLGRSFGRSVAFNDYPKSASLLGGFSSGISVCDEVGSITDVKYGVSPRTLVPPGPITGLPGQLYQWLSGSSDSGQHHQHQQGPPAHPLRRQTVARSPIEPHRFDRRLRRAPALRPFTQPPASILSTCQMNLDSAMGPFSAAGFWSRG